MLKNFLEVFFLAAYVTGRRESSKAFIFYPLQKEAVEQNS